MFTSTHVLGKYLLTVHPPKIGDLSLPTLIDIEPLLSSHQINKFESELKKTTHLNESKIQEILLIMQILHFLAQDMGNLEWVQQNKAEFVGHLHNDQNNSLGILEKTLLAVIESDNVSLEQGLINDLQNLLSKSFLDGKLRGLFQPQLNRVSSDVQSTVKQIMSEAKSSTLLSPYLGVALTILYAGKSQTDIATVVKSTRRFTTPKSLFGNELNNSNDSSLFLDVLEIAPERNEHLNNVKRFLMEIDSGRVKYSDIVTKPKQFFWDEYKINNSAVDAFKDVSFAIRCANADQEVRQLIKNDDAEGFLKSMEEYGLYRLPQMANNPEVARLACNPIICVFFFAVAVAVHAAFVVTAWAAVALCTWFILGEGSDCHKQQLDGIGIDVLAPEVTVLQMGQEYGSLEFAEKLRKLFMNDVQLLIDRMKSE